MKFGTHSELALLLEHAVHGTLREDVEERFAVAMNDCRQWMTLEEEARVAEIAALAVRA